MSRRHILVAGTVVALVAGVGGSQLLPGAAPAAHADGLVGYTGCDELLAHYRSELKRNATAYGFGTGGYGGIDDMGSPAAAGAAERSASGTDAVGSGPSGTNVQEQGVDEPDLAKLQDGRLVVLTGDRVRVLSAEAQPRLLGSLRIRSAQPDGGDQVYGGELLLDGDRALALVPGFRPDPQPQQGSPPGSAMDSRMYLPGTPTTRVLLLDVSADRPRLLEESTYDAQYVSARLVNGTVRLVTTTRPQPRLMYPSGPALSERQSLAANRRNAAKVTLSDVLPRVVRRNADGKVLQSGRAVGCTDTFHASTPTGISTLLVTTLRPGDGLRATDSTAVTTDGDLVYASADRLYVATSRWGTVGPALPMLGAAPRGRSTPQDEVTTELHAFDTSSAARTRYLGSGSVPGYVLGRWALSHHEGALRVATTRQPPWGGAAQTGRTSSMVVKLAERGGALVETGRVGGLGRTEQIRAVRYFGDIAAVVTFRQTDPLYLLDLSGTPKVLGELKIPGFSTYLHPIGDGLLLGVGQDADDNGGITGMQVSVFDIADLSDPTQVDRLRLGHGYSPALEDSRAFTYDPDRRLATFAFASYDATKLEGETSSALGITVDQDGQLREAGRMPIDPGAWTTRVLLDEDHLYAVGEAGLVAGDADTMDRTGSVDFDLSR